MSVSVDVILGNLLSNYEYRSNEATFAQLREEISGNFEKAKEIVQSLINRAPTRVAKALSEAFNFCLITEFRNHPEIIAESLITQGINSHRDSEGNTLLMLIAA